MIIIAYHCFVVCCHCGCCSKTGCLVFGPPSVPVIGDTEESVRSHGIPHKIFSGKEVSLLAVHHQLLLQ